MMIVMINDINDIINDNCIINDNVNEIENDENDINE